MTVPTIMVNKMIIILIEKLQFLGFAGWLGVGVGCVGIHVKERVQLRMIAILFIFVSLFFFYSFLVQIVLSQTINNFFVVCSFSPWVEKDPFALLLLLLYVFLLLNPASSTVVVPAGSSLGEVARIIDS